MEPDQNAWRAELRWLLDAYRAVTPVKDLVASVKQRHGSTGEWRSLEFQNAVVDIVIHDAIADKYAPPQMYTYRFLKSYTNEIERESGELSDALVCELMECIAVGHTEELSSLDSEQMHHVTYRIPAVAAGCQEDFTVTCRVASVFNEVGLKIWEAGWFLAEYILAHRELFEGRSVLELGAGVGFTGFVLAKAVRASRLVVSDYAPSVMSNLHYNTEINASEAPGYQCPVHVETLDWETWQPDADRDSTSSSGHGRPDILLAGDCVYDVATFPMLVRVLHAFLGSEKNEKVSERIAIFAATIRNQTTFQTFLATLEQQQITFDDITSSAMVKMGATPLLPYDNRDQIRLCKLYRKPVPSHQ